MIVSDKYIDVIASFLTIISLVIYVTSNPYFKQEFELIPEIKMFSAFFYTYIDNIFTRKILLMSAIYWITRDIEMVIAVTLIVISFQLIAFYKYKNEI